MIRLLTLAACGLWLSFTLLNLAARAVGGGQPPANELALTLWSGDHADIYLLDANSGGLVNLTHSQAHDFLPSWSPDGRRMVFLSSRGSRPAAPSLDLYALDLGTRAVTRLTRLETPFLYSGPAPFWHWSPDGREILFHYDAGGDNRAELYIIDVATGGQRRMDYDVSVWSVAWSPDGRQFALSGDKGTTTNSRTDLLFMDTASGEITLGYDIRYFDNEPQWSPDGGLVLMSSNDAPTFPGNIVLMDVATEQFRWLNRGDETPQQMPQWSPEGDWAAFPAVVHNRGTDTLAMVLVSQDMTGHRVLPVEGGGVGAFAWSPDGRTIAYRGRGASDSNNGIYLLSVESGENTALSAGLAGTPGEPLAWSADGRLVFGMFSARTRAGQGAWAADLYIAVPETGTVRLLRRAAPVFSEPGLREWDGPLWRPVP